MVERLGDAVGFYKIGLQLLATGGMAMAADLHARGRRVFLDWKLHDIGATVEKATAAVCGAGACDLLTVHAEPQVMRAAVRGRDLSGAREARIVGVTVLTSLSGQDLGEMGYGLGVEALVERRIRQAVDCGLDGVVASPREAALARRIGGPDFLVVTPGVRPAGAAHRRPGPGGDPGRRPPRRRLAPGGRPPDHRGSPTPGRRRRPSRRRWRRPERDAAGADAEKGRIAPPLPAHVRGAQVSGACRRRWSSPSRRGGRGPRPSRRPCPSRSCRRRRRPSRRRCCRLRAAACCRCCSRCRPCCSR